LSAIDKKVMLCGIGQMEEPLCQTYLCLLLVVVKDCCCSVWQYYLTGVTQ